MSVNQSRELRREFYLSEQDIREIVEEMRKRIQVVVTPDPKLLTLSQKQLKPLKPTSDPSEMGNKIKRDMEILEVKQAKYEIERLHKRERYSLDYADSRMSSMKVDSLDTIFRPPDKLQSLSINMSAMDNAYSIEISLGGSFYFGRIFSLNNIKVEVKGEDYDWVNTTLLLLANQIDNKTNKPGWTTRVQHLPTSTVVAGLILFYIILLSLIRDLLTQEILTSENLSRFSLTYLVIGILLSLSVFALRLVPPFAFEWGLQRKELEKRRRLQGILLGSVVLATMIGILIEYIT